MVKIQGTYKQQLETEVAKEREAYDEKIVSLQTQNEEG